MRLLAKEKYDRPFGIASGAASGRWTLRTVTGSKEMSGPSDGVGFQTSIEGFSSKEELLLAAAARGLPCVFIEEADRGRWLADVGKVRDMVASVDPGAVER